MTFNIIITQEFILSVDTRHYDRIFEDNPSPEQVIKYIKNEIGTNRIYWNALTQGKTEIKTTET